MIIPRFSLQSAAGTLTGTRKDLNIYRMEIDSSADTQPAQNSAE